MELNPTNLNIFFSSLQANWFTAYTLTPVWHDKIATDYPCESENFVAGWMGALQKMREWTGSRRVNNAPLYTYSVPMQTWEKTDGVDMFKLKSDQYGLYGPLVKMQAAKIAKNPDWQIRDLLQNLNSQVGIKQTAYDGVSYWNTAHPVNPYDASFGTYCTDFTGGGVSIGGITVGGAFSTIAFNTAYQEFSSRKDESGEALGIFPNLLQFPTQLWASVKTVLQATAFSPSAVSALTGHDTYVGQMDNVFKGMVDLEMTADLNAQNQTWYLWDTSMPIKPIGRAINTAPNFVIRVNPEDPVVFDTHQYLYGSYSRETPLFGIPWMGLRSSN
jgi:phage major head subunit gpT-like protein